ncbi:type IX secretion system outer membrane channel protein PorV [Filimonas effusa]|uniref:Type IX secretion system outer membrane channel protein PorV n=1 Tax=Filimonas effusa TaxID=2508721 RepID=A0A4Q1D1J4_9BACT|nr:type IX secretion system outer membrane channel protein PorV [Filimonas effusa]RXK81738.1 type IX secretion system outer membrane channel protein PorV [Filimonas effusa]
MKVIRFRITALLAVLCGTGMVQSKAQDINVVTTAVPFLRISPDARAGGMGDAGIATAPDANSSFWNQAKLPFAPVKSGISATYTPWLSDITSDVYLASLAGYYQIDDEQALSSSIRYFNLGSIQFTNINGDRLGTSDPREFAFDMGYTRRLSKQTSLGLALRYINSRLANGDVNGSGVSYKPGNAFGADISFFYNGIDETGAGFTGGAVLSNLGTKISYTNNANAKDYIPANLGVGVGYTWAFDEDSKLTLAADINKLLVPALPKAPTSQDIDDYYTRGVFESWFKSFGGDNGGFKSLQISGGAEYAYVNQFFARAGYYYEDKSQGGRRYLTMGVGFKYNAIHANFSYLIPSGSGVTRNPLSNTLRLGIGFDLVKE